MEESIEDLLARSTDYREAVRHDGAIGEGEERLAIEWLECNGCHVVHDDGTFKAWEDRTDGGNYVISTPHGLKRARRKRC